jgi:hypothetical protein
MDTIDAELETLAASLDDPAEAELLLALSAIASTAPPPDDDVDGYTPFVYPP